MYNKLFPALLGSSAAHAEASRKIFSELGLTEGQPKVLYILRGEDGIVQRKLAGICGIKESTLTVLLRKTEENSWIRRERDVTSAGKSISRIFLTEKGRVLADRLDEKVEAPEELGFHGFTADERVKLLSILERITNNIGSVKF